MTYDRVSTVNPGIVMISMPAFGTTGPYKNYRALGVNNEGVVGHNSLRGYADMDASAQSPIFSADAAAGASAAFAAMAALHHRRRTGQGQYIEVSQSENFLPYLGEYFMDYFMNGRLSETLGNRHPYALQGCYPCLGDDKWVNISIFDKVQWQAFCGALGHPEWTTESLFATHQDRRSHQDALDGRIAQWTTGIGLPQAGYGPAARGWCSRRRSIGPSGRVCGRALASEGVLPACLSRGLRDAPLSRCALPYVGDRPKDT